MRIADWKSQDPDITGRGHVEPTAAAADAVVAAASAAVTRRPRFSLPRSHSFISRHRPSLTPIHQHLSGRTRHDICAS